LGHEGGKQKHPCAGRLKALPLKRGKLHGLGAFREGGTFDGRAYFELGPAGEFEESLFGQDTLDGLYRNVYGLLAEPLCDIAGGKILPTPIHDFSSGLGTDLSAWSAIFGGRFGEVNFAVAELMPHDPQIANAEAKALGKNRVRQALNNGRPARLRTSAAIWLQVG
jgi:hypothetical protein